MEQTVRTSVISETVLKCKEIYEQKDKPSRERF